MESSPSSAPDSRAPYYEALGRFVDAFADVETAITLVLWHYAATPHEIARAVFSGVRVDAAIQFIRRLSNVIEIPRWDELDGVLAQLATINSVRNDLLHYGAKGSADGTLTVTNWFRALTTDRVKSYPISPQILLDMTADLQKIILHLQTGHTGRHWLLPTAKMMILREPWRYKPGQQP